MDLRKHKASLELSYVRLLCEQLDELSSANLTPLLPPEPDVLVESQSARIGIEVTEIHGNPRLRMVEGEHEQLLVRAQTEWQARGLPPVAVWVHWLPTHLARRLAKDLHAHLVEFLASRMPPRPASLELDGPEIRAAIGNNCGIEHIFLGTDWEEPTTFEQAHRWQGGVAGPSLIQREIDRKNPKPAKYVGSYSARWLLLVHHGGNPSSGFDIGTDIDGASFSTSFDRVYVLSLIGPRVRHLLLQP